MSNEAPTPRSNAAALETSGTVDQSDGGYCLVRLDFARTLERELTAANERIATLSDALRELVEVEDAPSCLTSDEVRASNARFDAAWEVARAALTTAAPEGPKP